MRRFLSIFALLLLSSIAFGQSSDPVKILDTVDDLILRKPAAGETVGARRKTSSLPQWPEVRLFTAYTNSVVTNAHDGTHYITNARPGWIYRSHDFNAAVQDAAWWGTAGDLSQDDSAALNAASTYTATYVAESAYTTLKGPGTGRLLIRPTYWGYLITNTVNIKSSVDASGAALVYRGPTNIAYNALLVAPANPTSTFINNHTFNLPDVWGWDRGFEHTNSVGIRVQGIGRSTINFPYVYRFYKAVEFLCDTEAVTLSTLNDGFFDTSHIGASVVITNGGYFNGNTWYGMRVNNENGNFSSNITNNFEIVRMENFGGSLNGNSWIGGSWEGFVGQRVVYIKNGSANLFTGMRLEHHVGDHTFDAQLLHMEVESDTFGQGIDNKILFPNQGVNGMNGIQVKETGLAMGNSGGSSQWTEYRTRDNGYNHGPLVLDASLAYPYQPILSVYPAMAWPSNHFTHYTNWVRTLSVDGDQWKVDTNANKRLHIEPSGRISTYSGDFTNKLQGQIIGGSFYGYDSSQINRLWLDGPSGALRLFGTAGNEVGVLRHYTGSTWGGWTISSVPTNELAGFTFAQTLSTDTGKTYAFPGVELIAGSFSTNYITYTIGAFGPDHPYNLMSDRMGIYVDADPYARTNAATQAYAAKGFRIALRPIATDFEITRGDSTTPSFKIDYSTTPGETRASIWDGTSGTAKRVMQSDGVLHFPLSGLTAGYVFTATSPTTAAWQAPTGGGSATNGTAVTVDSGSFLSVLNVQDGSKVAGTLTGTNLQFSIVADSLGTNDIDSATEAYFLSRANHTGTQLLSTISDAGTAASRNVPASGNAATNEVVLGSDSRLTDARTPTAHNHAASDVTSGVFATARLGTGTGTSSNFLRGDGAFEQVTTNDIPGLVAALAAGGGGGGTTNLVSSSTNGLAPIATVPGASLSTDSSTNVAWRQELLVNQMDGINVAVTNSTARTNFVAVTIPGNLITRNGDGVELYGFATYYNNTGSSLWTGLRLLVGTNSVLDSSSAGPNGASGASPRGFNVRWYILRTGATNAVAVVEAYLGNGSPNTFSGFGSHYYENVYLDWSTSTDVSAGIGVNVASTNASIRLLTAGAKLAHK